MSFPRHELEEMVRRWAEAGRLAESTGDWAGALGPFYAPDARVRVHVGADQVYVGRGRHAIAQQMLGEDMEGFEGWTYPHERVLIDEKRGEVVVYWRQVSPHRRSDGTPYAVAGLGNSYLRYAGGFLWSDQEDSFDLGQVTALLLELAAHGHLSPSLKRRIQRMARGHRTSGYERAPHALSPFDKARGYLAMTRIAIFGR